MSEIGFPVKFKETREVSIEVAMRTWFHFLASIGTKSEQSTIILVLC